MSSQVASLVAHCKPTSLGFANTQSTKPVQRGHPTLLAKCTHQTPSGAHSRQTFSQAAPRIRLVQSPEISTSRRLFLAVTGGFAAKKVSGFRKQRGGLACAAMTVEVAVKAAVGNPEILGDCPFSQRVLIVLEEKHIPYTKNLIDLSNKPQWYLEANPAGKVPALKTADGWLADSDEITKLLEKDYPEPSLATPSEKASVGSKIFPSFVAFLKSDSPTDGTEDALLAELEALDKALGEGEGPFIAGKSITQVDAALIPKLYHTKVALKELKGWKIPAKLENVHKYLKAAADTESFKKTTASDDLIVKGWLAHDGVKKQV